MSHISILKKYIDKVFLLVLVMMAFINLIKVADNLGMLDMLPGWEIDAIPAVISHDVYKHPANYTQLKDVNRTFREHLKSNQIQHIDEAIREASSLALNQITSDYSLLGNDDKGVTHFVSLSFKLFGYSASSIYKTYFGLLLLSLLSFLVVYWGSNLASFTVLLILFLETLLLPKTFLNGQLTSILALRVIPVVSIVSVFHLILATIYPKRTFLAFFCLLIQAVIVLLIIHVRFAAIWQLIAVLFAWFIILASSLITKPNFIPKNVSNSVSILFASIPLCLLLIGFLCLRSVEYYNLGEEYKKGEQIRGHVFWHSLFSGLSFDPKLANTFKIKLDDVSVITATGNYLKAHERNQDWAFMGGETPNYTGIKWKTYDNAVYDMLVDTCSIYLLHCFKALFIYKPIALLSNILWASNIRNTPPIPHLLDEAVYSQLVAVKDELSKKDYFYFLKQIIFIGSLALIAFFKKSKEASMPVFLGLIILWCGSLLPSLLAYPISHAVAEPTILTITFFVLVIFLAIKNFIYAIKNNKICNTVY